MQAQVRLRAKFKKNNGGCGEPLAPRITSMFPATVVSFSDKLQPPKAAIFRFWAPKTANCSFENCKLQFSKLQMQFWKLQFAVFIVWPITCHSSPSFVRRYPFRISRVSGRWNVEFQVEFHFFSIFFQFFFNFFADIWFHFPHSSELWLLGIPVQLPVTYLVESCFWSWLTRRLCGNKDARYAREQFSAIPFPQ